MRVLLVEPNPAILSALTQSAGGRAEVEACSDFAAAREHLATNNYERLITNLRLEAHNGLHLVYLARTRSPGTRCVVYTDQPEFSLAREVQESGAFYEVREHLRYSIQGYIEGDLPSADRRAPAFTPRRAAFRGGRRHADKADSPGGRFQNCAM